jgi:carbohydrate-selective porin OprB
VYELYYNAKLTTRAELSPSIQYITHPAKEPGVRDALVLGIRLQIKL